MRGWEEESHVPAYGWGMVLLAIYVLLVILARWICIARTNVVWISAHATAMTRRLSLEGRPSSTGNGESPAPEATLQPLFAEIKKHTPTSKHSGIIGWNGSHQIAQWTLIHEAERLALPALSHA